MNYLINDTVNICMTNKDLLGELIVPEKAKSIILFSHGSGSSRLSPRNTFVASEFHKQNIGTYLFDLLTAEEDLVYENRFDIELLTERLIHVTKCIALRKEFYQFNIGYYGASTGAASALKAAAALPNLIQAIVSRGGRPDLAIDIAEKVKAPTLLIVGELDLKVRELNQEFYDLLTCEKKLETVPGATHLFEEEGALSCVSLLAKKWFKQHLNK
jgi:putative phosphoribosyl transferase